MMTAKYKFQTELGVLQAVVEDNCLIELKKAPDDLTDFQQHDAPHPLCQRTEEQVREYLAHQRTQFDLPLAPKGTAFQKSIWQALCTVPYGETRSYKDICRLINHPSAARAVGAAIGRNPIWIIIPCHRIIGSNGALTGYAGGLDMKRALLEIENSI